MLDNFCAILFIAKMNKHDRAISFADYSTKRPNNVPLIGHSDTLRTTVSTTHFGEKRYQVR